MAIIYIAGPYRSITERGLVDNIREAEDEAIKLWKWGWAVITPHMNTAHLGGTCPDETFLEGDIEILKRCDAIYMMDTWQKSVGATNEMGMACRYGIPAFFAKDYDESNPLKPDTLEEIDATNTAGAVDTQAEGDTETCSGGEEQHPDSRLDREAAKDY